MDWFKVSELVDLLELGIGVYERRRVTISCQNGRGITYSHKPINEVDYYINLKEFAPITLESAILMIRQILNGKFWGEILVDFYKGVIVDINSKPTIKPGGDK